MPRNSLQQAIPLTVPIPPSPADPFQPTTSDPTPMIGSSAGPSPRNQRLPDAHGSGVAGDLLQPTIDATMPKVDPSAEPLPEHAQSPADVQIPTGVFGFASDNGQRARDVHDRAAAVGSTPPPPTELPTPKIVAGAEGPILFNPYLGLFADSLSDIEDLRVRTENRLRMLTRTEEDKDGAVRGLGMNIIEPNVGYAVTSLSMMFCQSKLLTDAPEKGGLGLPVPKAGPGCCLEHEAIRSLQRELRRTPFNEWVKSSKGIGEKQAARLLATIGDPYWNDLHNRPRTVSELWAYCGYAVHNGRADRRTKGQRSNWSNQAKMRAFVMAESCVRALGGDYRTVYDLAREKYADATHPDECVRCGPAGKPALPGTPLSAGHQHQRALRIVSKTILRDIWMIARDYHQEVA